MICSAKECKRSVRNDTIGAGLRNRVTFGEIGTGRPSTQSRGLIGCTLLQPGTPLRRVQPGSTIDCASLPKRVIIIGHPVALLAFAFVLSLAGKAPEKWKEASAESSPRDQHKGQLHHLHWEEGKKPVKDNAEHAGRKLVQGYPA